MLNSTVNAPSNKQTDRETFARSVEAIESSTLAVCIVDRNGIIKYMSPTAEAWFEYKACELEDEYDIGVFMEDATRHLNHHIKAVIDGEIPSRPMAGGRYVPALTKLGHNICVKIAYQNTIIDKVPYAVIVLMRKSLATQVKTAWFDSRAAFARAAFTISSVLSTLILFLTTVIPHIRTMSDVMDSPADATEELSK